MRTAATWVLLWMVGCAPAADGTARGTTRSTASAGDAAAPPQMLVVRLEVRADGGVVLLDAFRAEDRRNPVRGTPAPTRFRLDVLDAGGQPLDSTDFDASLARTLEAPTAEGDAAHVRVDLPAAPALVRVGAPAGATTLRVVRREPSGAEPVVASASIADLERAHAARP